MMEYERPFFKSVMSQTVAQIAEFTGAHLYNAQYGARVIDHVGSIEKGDASALTFIESKKYVGFLPTLVAGAILCSEQMAALIPDHVAILISQKPHYDFSSVTRLFYPIQPEKAFLVSKERISSEALIAETAQIGENVRIEKGAVIGHDVVIGAGSYIGSHVVIGNSCHIGQNCYIGPHVSLQYAQIGDHVALHPNVCIGQDGFGYVQGATGVEKVPQIGGVIIENDVEIGANTTIDRGSLSNTFIGAGTKIDNQVQIGHNVRIGRHCVISAKCGISGTVIIGDGVMMGGGAGIADHVTIGSGAKILAASGVMRDIPNGEKWGGLPAQPAKKWFRYIATLEKIVK